MNCPGCQRDNAAKRRYCGRCGFNFDPVCRACSFVNDHDDRYCGGCGDVLGQTAPASRATAAQAPIAKPAAAVPAVPAIKPTATATAPAPAAAALARAAAAPPASPPPKPAPAPAKPAAAAPSSELAGLFATPAMIVDSPQIPETGVSQGDLDRLFGAT